MSPQRLNVQSAQGNSPTVHAVDDHTWLIQGYRTDAPGVPVPPNEDTVILPALLAIDAAAAVDPNGMNLADVYRMLRVFRESSFRLETRDYYAADHEDPAPFQHWLTTGDLPASIDDTMAGWRDLVARHISAGHTMRRVHLYHGEPSATLRYELAIQREHSVPAGERIHILDTIDCPDLVDDHSDLLPNGGDFWLFDNRIGVWMVYDQEGELVRIERMTAAEVDQARDIRDRAWGASTPLANATEPASAA